MSDEIFKKPFSVTLPKPYVEGLYRLVEEGLYMNHTDAIREALRRLLRFHGIAPFTAKVAAARTRNG